MIKHILIVDDSRVMRGMIARTIAMAGLEAATIHEAANGAEALAKVHEKAYDLVLLDINMPVMDGEEFLAALRAEPAFRQLPVVVASSESNDARIRRLRLMGAEFVHKPFRPEALIEAIERMSAGDRT